MMLSGYCPSAALVQEVGKIARSLRTRNATNPGSFFWVLDPVMGDNGRIYVDEDELPVYKTLLHDADLILPNQFEAELLSGVEITDLKSMRAAIETLHAQYKLPHILITSIRLPASQSATPSSLEQDLSGAATLSVVGSSCTAGDSKPACLDRAELAERLASRETEPVAKAELLDLASGWRQVAVSYEYVERLENFLKTHKAPKGPQSEH